MTQDIARLSNAIALLRRQLNKDLPSQHIALLLAVALQPGITMPELCRELDMPQGTVSRNVKLLSSFRDKSGSREVRGYGLLETDQSQKNRYQLAVYLTAAGDRLIQRLVRVMGGEEVKEREECGPAYAILNQMLS